jgi:flagellar hook-associated protein 2
MADPVFTVGGLATGMDTQSMIDKLVSLESRPLTLLQKHESGFKAQVSALGSISSSLAALQTAAQKLATGGTLGLKTTSTNTAFSATPGSSAVAASYDVKVQQLATQAKWQSAGFGASDTVKGGTFTITPSGSTPFTIEIGDGASMEDVASAIRNSGAPVSAVVLNDDSGKHLSITSTATGSAAPAIAFNETGASGTKSLGLLSTQPASDAIFKIDDLTFTRSSNTVTDALPGTTLQLQKVSPLDPVTSDPIPETLTLANDVDATQANLKTFVDAYNSVMQLVQKHLNVTAATDRASTLAGDPGVRSLQRSLQRIGSSIVGQSSVRSLADIGLATQRDGTLAINSSTLAAAIARDPNAVNRLFADSSSGISKITGDLVSSFTGPGGMLITRQDGLKRQIDRMDDQAANMQLRIDNFRKSLARQFTAMENVVSRYKNIGTFLSQQSYSSIK